jgi:hypothetical protein
LGVIHRGRVGILAGISGERCHVVCGAGRIAADGPIAGIAWPAPSILRPLDAVRVGGFAGIEDWFSCVIPHYHGHAHAPADLVVVTFSVLAYIFTRVI